MVKSMPRLPINRAVYIGSEALLRRLRAAKRPDIIVPLEIPPEEMDIEPTTADHSALPPPQVVAELSGLPMAHLDDLPVQPRASAPMTITPARLSADEIVPDESDD
jgi:hypothetical protein